MSFGLTGGQAASLALGAGLSFLGGGDDDDGPQQVTTQKSDPFASMPPWLKAYYEQQAGAGSGALRDASAIYNAGKGGGTRAQDSIMEQKSREGMASLPGHYQPLEDLSAQRAADAMQAYDDAYASADPIMRAAEDSTGRSNDLINIMANLATDPDAMRKGYEDPYFDAIASEITREGDRQKLADEASAAKYGGLTGSRAAVADMLREEMTSRELASAKSDAFRFATDAGFQRMGILGDVTDQSNEFTGLLSELGQARFGMGMDVGKGRADLSALYDDLAGGRSERGLDYFSQLEAMGQREQEDRQAELDEPWTNLARYQDAIAGAGTSNFPSSSSSTSTSQVSGGGGNDWSQILSGAATGLGLYDKFTK